MAAFGIREATSSDARLLTDMLVEAANWNRLAARPRVEVLADRGVLRYISGWKRPGDHGVVALDPEGIPIGACWYRLFPGNDPGYGFVSPGVPELTLGVNPMWRARGAGRELLQALVRDAAAAGHARLSLSVDRGNHAQGLYRSEGFVVVSSGDDSDTMVKALH
ncbi:GNAT family N-acetyltransferase [Compostimonas suwonensis]|uniref:Acetyltransferase (GNAT) family protein n=1 Tax=Compostimonas suwonensis TaxID=1048394 RepID=A0A2M9BTQ4_9MICO|nr:GNAT family N-acetyltransferase [Compostimonas suwonensis]PJJ61344.1 acetyltransferase (GNAT) family protein [Compostimonas suwonensis]